MRATVELDAAEKDALRSLTGEEREAVIDQMLERVREDLEWVMAMEHARSAVVEAPRVRRLPPPLPQLRRNPPKIRRAL